MDKIRVTPQVASPRHPNAVRQVFHEIDTCTLFVSLSPRGLSHSNFGAFGPPKDRARRPLRGHHGCSGVHPYCHQTTTQIHPRKVLQK